MAKTQTRPWDPAGHLETGEDMAAYLNVALEEGDLGLIMATLGDIARARRMSVVAQETGLGRESLYKSLSADGNPEFATVLKVVRALGLRLRATVPEAPVSRSLDFDIPPAIAKHRQTLHVLTPSCAPMDRVRKLRKKNIHVVSTRDSEWVGSIAIAQQLKVLGSRTAYLFCGPQLNGIMLRAGLIQRMYLTWLHRLQGGSPLSIGTFLPKQMAINLKLRELHLAEPEVGLPSFWLGCFEP